MNTAKIRRLLPEDEQAWHSLWQDYNHFYERKVESRVTTRLWNNLASITKSPFGLAGELNGTLVGFAHYFYVPSTSDWSPRCYMQDLFVSDTARGNGLGKALIKAVENEASKEGAAQTYWLTDKNNTLARKLYNQVATETNFIKYRC